MKYRVLFLIFTTTLLSSCASYFTRKECEKRNWFEYGHQVAMSGKRLSGDQYLSECRKVEAQIQESQLDLGFKSGMSTYCKADIVFATGRKGQFFNTDLCDPGQLKMLTAKHAEGVQAFCEPTSGFSFGSSGGVYNQICPKDKEDAFMKEYRKGRKKFLAASIAENQSRIGKINSDLSASNNRKFTLENDLKIIEAVQLVRPRAANANPNEVDPAEQKKRDLKTKINQEESVSNSLNNNRSRLQEQIYSMEKEILTLD